MHAYISRGLQYQNLFKIHNIEKFKAAPIMLNWLSRGSMNFSMKFSTKFRLCNIKHSKKSFLVNLCGTSSF